MAETRSKPILQIDEKTDKVIKEWESATEVFEILGFNRGVISQCCTGKQKSAYNYKWRFK